MKAKKFGPEIQLVNNWGMTKEALSKSMEKI